MNVALTSPVDRLIGAHLIESLNEAGYLVEEVDEIAIKLGAEVERIEAVLACLQGLDPTGIGARTPAECFALQLKEIDRLDPVMQTLLDNLELLGTHDIDALKRKCGVDDEDMTEMIAEIRALNPRPGLAYDYEVAQAVVPDVFVRRGSDGLWRVELNSGTLPRVLVNRRYASLVERPGCSREDRAYLTDQINNANWLVKSLDQRANTILRVASEIVRQQEAFLEHGVRHLKPLNLRAIAEAIEMHESTVSRVTSNKYMATPRGIFELKYFFTSAIASAAGGEAHSAEAVKHRIRELIDAEIPKAILSDDSLVELLHASGIDIARRTVAKYREAMRIPSSVQRRRQKRLSA
jgi:RNA polymerase sigma-54 factor